MRVRVIRTIRRAPTRPDAGAIEPRLHVTPRPHPAPGALRIALGRIISASRILRPIERETVAHKPFAEIGAANRTAPDGRPVLIQQRAGCFKGPPQIGLQPELRRVKRRDPPRGRPVRFVEG
jgi:hypothetical protein